ncbi:MAG: hypothetical protein ACOX6Y_01210 [Christensenellales bacterium]
MISIAGNAKNAGKTTVLNALIAAHRGDALGVSSIGLDGEALDTVSMLPKPSIHLDAGSLVASAMDCVMASEAALDVIGRSQVQTGLGEIIYARVKEPGACLVAGPSTVQGMEQAVGQLKAMGAGKVFIDGAFARASHALSADGLVFVVGAHDGTQMPQVVDKARLQIQRFSLQEADEGFHFLENEHRLGWLEADLTFHPLHLSSALGQEERLIDALPRQARWLWLPGALSPAFARAFVKRRGDHGCGIVLRSPLALVAEGRELKNLFLLDRPLRVLMGLRLAFVALNPFSPAGHRFDAAAFKDAIRQATDLPLINVLEDTGFENRQ